MKKWHILTLMIITLSGCGEIRPPKVINSGILVEGHPRHLILSDINKIDHPIIGSSLSDLGPEIKLLYIVPETNEESTFGNIRFTEFIEEGVLLTDGQSLFRFNQDGRFVWKVHNQGRGPGEYINIGGIAVDQRREEILLSCSESGRVFIYDYHGKYLEEFPIRGGGGVKVIDSAKYLVQTASNYSKTWVLLADRSGSILKDFNVNELQSKVYDHGRSSPYFTIRGIGPFIDGYYMWHSDTVWYLDSNFDNPSPIVVIDAKIRGGGTTLFDPVYQRKVNVSGIRDRHYMYSLYGRTDGLIFINYFFDNRNLFYDLPSGSFYETPEYWGDDIDYGPVLRRSMPIVGRPSVDFLYPHDILSLDGNKIRKESALYEIHKNIKPNDNPVIRIINRD